MPAWCWALNKTAWNMQGTATCRNYAQTVLYGIWDVPEKQSPYRDWGTNFGGTLVYSLHQLVSTLWILSLQFLLPLCHVLSVWSVQSSFMIKFRLFSPWHSFSFQSEFCVSHWVFWKTEAVSYAIFPICKSSKDWILCTLDGKHTASLLRT